MNEAVKIICLTPVRNEAWILDRFLQCTSLWADHIIIADQMSTDGSREIAERYSKVILVDNTSESFNEPERQKLLIDEARKISGPRLLITLDADEIFTPNVLISAEWATMLAASPGTIFKFQWANIKADFQNMWLAGHFSWGYMDDGYQHVSEQKIHTARIPLPLLNTIVTLNQIKVIHLQFINWNRMQSKHRWYQCYEILNDTGRRALDIFRTYHHMYGLTKDQVIPVPVEWIEDYNKLGIDITSVSFNPLNHFDKQALSLIEEHGAFKFKKLYIWDTDWIEKAKMYGKNNLEVYKDPRSRWDKLIHKYLMRTQSHYKNLLFRLVDKLIKTVFKY